MTQAALKTEIHQIPCTWIPPFMLRVPRSALRVPSARLSPGEREVLKRRRPIRPSVWAERHRVVTMSRYPGPWRNDLTPYLPGIMDAIAFPSVRTGILCKSPQIGGSEAVNNLVGYFVDRDPGPALYVYPDSVTGRENMKDRILPMLEESKRLAGYFTGWDDDKASLRIKLIHMPIYLAWAGSASRLANKPIKHVIFDETDKYPDAGKRETDPIRLGEHRTTTYEFDCKKIKISTPTTETGPIWQAMATEAQVIFDYYVKCPGCGHSHVMSFDNIKWNKAPDADGKEQNPDPERMETLELAWYECPHCHCRWDNAWRDKAVRAGEWRSWFKDSKKWRMVERPDKPETPVELFKYLNMYQPSKIGFHLPAWLSRFVSLSKVAASFLKGLHDINAYKDFVNAFKAMPWIIRKQERKEDAILALRDDRPRGVIPGEGRVAVVTAGVDTQDFGFWYEIRAWSWGMDLTSWGIREGFVESFEVLARILWEDEYNDTDGRRHLVRLSVHDAMGHRTSDVYDFARMHRGYLLPLKGEQSMAAPYGLTDVEFYPATKKPIPGGLKLLRANVTYFKNQLSNKLNISPNDPGAWNLNSETTFEWARQMTAEYVNEKGLWECKSGAANHGWDCSVYNLVAAEVLGVRHWKKTRSAERGSLKSERGTRNAEGGEAPQRPAAGAPRNGYHRPGWLNR